MKRFFLFFLLAFLIGALAGQQIKRVNNSPKEVEGDSERAESVLFYGKNCPHCGKVEEWLDEHPEVKRKINLQEKEVYDNKENSGELITRAKECGIATENGSIGVPFLYDRGQCLMGDRPIINYLNDNYNR